MTIRNGNLLESQTKLKRRFAHALFLQLLFPYGATIPSRVPLGRS
jgi:hypothetical protein